jgi:hypothetical protein
MVGIPIFLFMERRKNGEPFHRIEEGPFYTLEEADEEFEIWKKNLLASRL